MRFINRLKTDQYYLMKYEALASNPEMEGKKLCYFLGVEFDPAMLELGHKQRHMVHGNETRFSARKGIVLDERWKSELANIDEAWFYIMGSRVNKKLGYQ